MSKDIEDKRSIVILEAAVDETQMSSIIAVVSCPPNAKIDELLVEFDMQQEENPLWTSMTNWERVNAFGDWLETEHSFQVLHFDIVEITKKFWNIPSSVD